MPMKVEAAIVTQKRAAAAYNTDSVNVNGKVMPREVIKNGYKGSGVLSGNVYFALTSSDVEGFADASVAAFNDRAELFSCSREPMSVFSGFFEDCRGALLNMNRSDDELVAAGFYASGRRAVIANNGDTRIYLQRLGIASPVTTEKVSNTTADFSGSVFTDVCEGDIFILLSPGASAALGDREIEDILRISDGSVKKIVNYILKVALASDGDRAVSAIVVKILETELEEEIAVPAFVPDFNEKKEEAAASETEAVAEAPAVAVEESVEPEISDVTLAQEESSVDVTDKADELSSIFAKSALEMFEEVEIIGEEDMKKAELYTEEIDEISESPEEAADEESAVAAAEDNKKSRTPLFIILGVMLALSVALIIAFFVVPAFSGDGEETTVEETSVDGETTEEASTEEESASEDENEEAAAQEDVTDEITTNKSSQETTTKRASQETTTKSAANENTTASSVAAPEVTTAAPEVTTAAPEETTEAPEETEATTNAEEETSAEVTTAAEETTAAETEPSTEAAVTDATSTEAQTEAETEDSEETEAVL